MNAQLFFLHSVLLPLLKAAKMGLIDVLFADGVHLTYGYQGGYCWCKERRCVPSAYGRKRANLLGFILPSILTPSDSGGMEYFKTERQKRGELGRKTSG